jgi:hypothetical protein
MKKEGDSLSALNFMMVYGSMDDAEVYFNGYVKRQNWKGKIRTLYTSLETIDKIDFSYSEFWEAALIKNAFVQGLRLQ